MAVRKERNKHLTDDLRLELENAVRKRKSFSQIKRELGIPRSTVKREIMNHREESTKTFYGPTHLLLQSTPKTSSRQNPRAYS